MVIGTKCIFAPSRFPPPFVIFVTRAKIRFARKLIFSVVIISFFNASLLLSGAIMIIIINDILFQNLRETKNCCQGELSKFEAESGISTCESEI